MEHPVALPWPTDRSQGQSVPGPRSAPLGVHGDPLPPGAALRLGTVKYRQDSPIYRVAFTPDGSRLVSGMADGSVLVWDVRSGPAVR